VCRMLRCCAVATFTFAASLGLGATQTLHVTDLQGRAVAQLATNHARVVVLVFAATDCPISNRYVPEISRLDRELAAKGVAFWWVFPNPGDTLPAVRKHDEDFSIATATILDARQELVRMAHVAVTPEAAVFAVDKGSLHEVYHGRIDDRYIAFGQERPQAARHELEEVIQAVLAGRPVPKPEAGPVGCSIIRVSPKP
jgi:Redoxin